MCVSLFYLYLGSSTDSFSSCSILIELSLIRPSDPAALGVLPLPSHLLYHNTNSFNTRPVTVFFSLSSRVQPLTSTYQKCLQPQTLRPVAASPARTLSSPGLPGRCHDSSCVLSFIPNMLLVALALRRPSSSPRRVLPFSCLTSLSLLLKRLLPRSSSSSPTLPVSRSL